MSTTSLFMVRAMDCCASVVDMGIGIVPSIYGIHQTENSRDFQKFTDFSTTLLLSLSGLAFTMRKTTIKL